MSLLTGDMENILENQQKQPGTNKKLQQGCRIHG